MPSMLNLEEGISLQALRPSAHRSHSLLGFVTSPANLQLMPIMAMGVLLSMMDGDTLRSLGSLTVWCCQCHGMWALKFEIEHTCVYKPKQGHT